MITVVDFVMVVPATVNRTEAVMSNNGNKNGRWVVEGKKNKNKRRAASYSVDGSRAGLGRLRRKR